LGRLHDIIGETESSTNTVLEIVDNLFSFAEEMEQYLNSDMVKGQIPSEVVTAITDRVALLSTWTMELNNSQGIQDRVGQQLQKVIPSIETFHGQLMDVARKLQLNIGGEEISDEAQAMKGYTDEDSNRMEDQGDVDSLLADLGL